MKPTKRTPAERPAAAKPRPRDAAATRQRLAEVAAEHFVERGYDAARVDDIAAAAGINKRMIYAYFGDKEGLYLAVLRESLQGVQEAMAEGGPLPEAPRARTEALLRRFFTYLDGHPAFVRLATWETLHYGRRAASVLQETLGPALERLRGVIAEGVRAGVFRADLEPRFVTHSLSALCLSFFAQRELLASLWGMDLQHPAARAAVLEHLLALAFHGIDAPAAAARAKGARR